MDLNHILFGIYPYVAMSVLVIAACLTVRILYFWITRPLHRRTQAWRLP